jgi:hypothetical protein
MAVQLRLSSAHNTHDSGSTARDEFQMDHRTRLRNLLLLLLLGLLASCAQLPEHAQPRFHAPQGDNLASGKGFSYRQLLAEDFQAASLPPEYRQYDHTIGAHSCISIRPSRDLKIHIVHANYQDMLFYSGTILNLKFEAIFVPECSWWNPALDRRKKEYVLEHEQIHFALAELVARKLTSTAAYELQSYIAFGVSYTEVQQELIEKLKNMGQETMESSLQEHTDFDEDTSLFHDPQTQRKWLESIKTRLAVGNDNS